MNVLPTEKNPLLELGYRQAAPLLKFVKSAVVVLIAGRAVPVLWLNLKNSMNTVLRWSVFLMIAAVFLPGCQSLNTDPPILYTYQPPETVDDGWPVSSLASQQLAVQPLEELTNLIRTEQYRNIHSLLVVRNGQLVYEEYFNGYTRSVPENLYSATKSITSALIGMAVDQRAINNLHEKVVRFFPQYTDLANPSPAKNEMTIRDLLTMRSGLECNDDDPKSPGYEGTMYQSTDWFRFALGLPMASQPGETATYCTGGVALLGGILQQATGKTVEAFAQHYLWEPLRIQPVRWQRMPSGPVNTSGMLFMRPRDMAKIGQLFLNKGQWEGRQILSADWVAESTRKQVMLREQEYGYLWWRREFVMDGRTFPAYYASGNGGQLIVVLPEQNLVVVSTAGNLNYGLSAQLFGMIRFHILPALP